MKRTQLESWSTLEKYILASHIPHSGDPNWGSISYKTKNVFEDVTSFISEEKRPNEWFAEKQCLWQYENLLKNVPRKKRRLEKALDYGDNIQESLVQSLKQELTVELSKKLAEEQAQYAKLFKEHEEILSGRLDHKLEEMMGAIEAKEREKEIKMKLKFKIGEKNLESDIKKENEARVVNETPPPQEPPKTNVTTSPLLTSLLQSPSPLTRPSIPSTASPTISLLLNSSPSVPTKDSPTLSKLLESTVGPPQPSTSSSLLSQAVSSVSPLKLPTPEKKIENAPSLPTTPVEPQVSKPVEIPVKEKTPEAETPPKATQPEPIIEDESTTPRQVVEEIIESVIESEIIIEQEEQKEIAQKKAIPRKLDMDNLDGTEEEVMVTVEQIIEKVEEAIIETVGGSEDICDIELNQTIESETLDDQIECLDLDHEAVELIVMGPNQGPVITVRHDTSSETNNDDSSKSEDIKPDSVAEVESIVDEETIFDNTQKEKTQVQQPEEAMEVESKENVEIKKEAEEVQEESKTEDSVSIDSTVKAELEEESSKSSESTETKEVKEKEVEEEEEEDEEEEEEEEEKSEEVVVKKEPSSPIELTDTTSNDISEPISVISSNEDEKISNDDSQSQPESVSQKATETRLSKKQRSHSLETVKEEEEESKPVKSETRYKSTLDMPSTPDSRDVKEEGEKRRTRKRHSLTASDSKPSSPSPSTFSNDDDRDFKLWKKSILLVYNRLAAHKFASVFLKPITEAEATGYHSVILKPVDLTTIKRNIENGTIKTTVEFQLHMLLMVQNAVMYNKSDTLVHKMAQTMLVDMHAQMEVMVQALGDGVFLGRETEEKALTRGRSSKASSEDTPKRKRNSTAPEETPRPKRKRSDLSN